MEGEAARARAASLRGRDWWRPRPEEIVLGAFVVALAAFATLGGHAPALLAPPLWRVARKLHVYFLGATALLALVWLVHGYRLARARAQAAGAGTGDGRSRRASLRAAARGLGSLVRDFAPFYGVMVLYEALHDLTPLLPGPLRDPILIRIDRAVLGVDAAAWMERFGSPAWSWVMAAAYGSYYVLPGVLAVALYAGHHVRLFRDFMLAGVLASALGFVGYLLVPAVGPYVFQSELFPTRLPGGAYSPAFVRAVDDLRGMARDCFPSLHAAHATIILIHAHRFRRAVFLGLLPVGAALFLSTIYLRMHYVVDLAAGVVTAVVASWAAVRINQVWWKADRTGPPPAAT